MSIRISPFLLPEKRIEKAFSVYLLNHFLYLFLLTVILELSPIPNKAFIS